MRRDCDLVDSSRLRDVLVRAEPAAVINTAAYTQVDRAEEDERECWHINAEAVETLAAVCRELNCPLVQVSTDYVFGGDLSSRLPYKEDDHPKPRGVYARSKLAGERAVRSSTWWPGVRITRRRRALFPSLCRLLYRAGWLMRVTEKTAAIMPDAQCGQSAGLERAGEVGAPCGRCGTSKCVRSVHERRKSGSAPAMPRSIREVTRLVQRAVSNRVVACG